jgi:hypothetical protein
LPQDPGPCPADPRDGGHFRISIEGEGRYRALCCYRRSERDLLARLMAERRERAAAGPEPGVPTGPTGGAAGRGAASGEGGRSGLKRAWRCGPKFRDLTNTAIVLRKLPRALRSPGFLLPARRSWGI